MTSPAQDRLPTPQLGQLHHQRKWTELHFGKWIFWGGNKFGWHNQERGKHWLKNLKDATTIVSLGTSWPPRTPTSFWTQTAEPPSRVRPERFLFGLFVAQYRSLLFHLRDRKISQKGLIFLGHHLVTIFSNSTSLENNLDWTSCPNALTTQIGNALS